MESKVNNALGPINGWTRRIRLHYNHSSSFLSEQFNTFQLDHRSDIHWMVVCVSGPFIQSSSGVVDTPAQTYSLFTVTACLLAMGCDDHKGQTLD